MSIGKRRFGLDSDTAKEKIQETFVSVWKNKTFIKNNSEPGVRGYALRTFRNICINHLRRKHPFVESGYRDQNGVYETDGHIEAVKDETAHPLFEILLIEEKRLQEKAVAMLPVKYQEPVRLSLTGLAPRDISIKTGLKLATLTNYKHRGFQMFEKIINTLDPMRKN